MGQQVHLLIGSDLDSKAKGVERTPGQSGASRRLRSAAVLVAFLAFFPLLPAGAETVVIDNTTAGSIDASTTCGGSELTRTFTVSESFLVEDVDLGFNASHFWRGDIQVTLQSPAATSVVIIASDGLNFDNYDLALDDDVADAVNDGDADTISAPLYHLDRSASPSNPLGTFVGENVNGTWTLLICDTFSGADDGTFNSAQLTLRGPDSAAAAIDCVNTGSDGDAAGLSGVINAYFSPAASAAAGDSSLQVTSATGLAAGDKVLVIQMQDSSIDSTDSSSYGDGSAGDPATGSVTDRWSGYYEFVGVTSVTGSAPSITLGLTTALQNSYWSRGRSSFQVIRVPQYGDVTLGGTVTASAWNGSTGGVVVLEAGSTLDFNGQSIVLDGLGFRGGVSNDSDTPPNFSVYLTTDLEVGAAKAEGTAGTPASSGGTGYPAGDLARGAPANAGGGGNEHNAGGGGGGNGGAGGQGGDTWIGFGQTPNGGVGGAVFPASRNRLVLGGGGGAGASNDLSFPDGGNGGGIVIIQAYEVVGTGTITADGLGGDPADCDAAGAGGAGGSVLVAALNGSLANLALGADGGSGGDSTCTAADLHGPGGGGGGGAIFYSTGAGTPTTSVAAGSRGSFLPDIVAYGSSSGQAGTVSTFTATDSICTTLPVTLASFSSSRTRHGWQLEWTTATETSTVGYQIFGRIGDRWQPLNDPLVPSHQIDSLEPQRYSLQSYAAEDFEAFSLVDIDIKGRHEAHGPFFPGHLEGREVAAKAIDWRSIAEQRPANRLSEIALKRFDRASSVAGKIAGGKTPTALWVDTDGIYRSTHEELLAAGFDFRGVPVHQMALEDPSHGLVPVYIQGSRSNPQVFGPGGFVEFLGRAVRDSQYTRSRVYHLKRTRSNLPVRVVSATPQHLPPAVGYEESREVHQQNFYSFASPNGDPWYQASILANGGAASRTFDIEIDALAPNGDAVLEVDLWGVTNWPGSEPDHHLEIRFNGELLGEEWFDGLTARSLHFPIAMSRLSEGPQQLEIRLPGDTGFAFDLVHLDRFRLRYPRKFVASDDRLEFSGRFREVEVAGLSSPNIVIYASASTRLDLFEVAAGDGDTYTATFSAPGFTEFIAAGSDAWQSPRIEQVWAPSPNLLRGQADYLVVSHGDFLGELDDLISARERSGFEVKVVDARDLYARYSGGVFDPQAIRRYIAEAHRQLGVRFVLLVGGDTYDYLDHLSLGSISFIPTLYTQTDEIVHFAPADPLFGDVDGDGLPDVAIGRLPVRTAEELAAVIAKTLTYKSSRAAATFVSDDTPGRTLTKLSEELAQFVPRSWKTEQISLDDLTVTTARERLQKSFETGQALINFVGHSGPTAWTFDGLLDSADIDQLDPNGKPSVVIQWGCWNTYHVSPRYDTLGHRFLLAEDAGAAAVIGSSMLSKLSSDRALGPAMLERLMRPGTSLGQAMLEAKRSLGAGQPELLDVLLGWTLLGDPALVVVGGLGSDTDLAAN